MTALLTHAICEFVVNLFVHRALFIHAIRSLPYVRTNSIIENFVVFFFSLSLRPITNCWAANIKVFPQKHASTLTPHAFVLERAHGNFYIQNEHWFKWSHLVDCDSMADGVPDYTHQFVCSSCVKKKKMFVHEQCAYEREILLIRNWKRCQPIKTQIVVRIDCMQLQIVCGHSRMYYALCSVVFRLGSICVFSVIFLSSNTIYSTIFRHFDCVYSMWFWSTEQNGGIDILCFCFRKRVITEDWTSHSECPLLHRCVATWPIGYLYVPAVENRHAIVVQIESIESSHISVIRSIAQICVHSD